MILQVTNADVEPIVQSARAISEYGILIVIAALMLIFTFWMFKHFMNMFQEMFDKVSENQYNETPMEQVRVLQSIAFDLSKYNLLTNLIRIYGENNIDNREAVQKKIHDALVVIHNDLKSKFDNFKYHGYALSYFCDDDWIDKMSEIGMAQIYASSGEFKQKQAFAAIDIAYNQIKIEFYNNVISKS